MEKQWQTYTGRLLWAMQNAGKTNQSELARTVGVKPQSIQYLCRTDAGAQGSKHTPALAQALGVSAAWLARGEGGPHTGDGSLNWRTESGRGFYEEGRDGQAPVIGSFRVSGSGDVERIDLPEGEADGHVRMPLHAPGACAVRIKGNALAPYVKDGQYLLLEPGGALHAEENLAITFKDQRTVIRELLLRKTDTLVVLPVHGGQTEALELGDIADVVPIVCVVPQSKWVADRHDATITPNLTD